jgi:fucose permease
MRAARPRPERLLLALAYLGFISLGLPDAALGIVWPSLRSTFDLPQSALGWPLAAAALGYFSSGLLAGRAMHRSGVGRLLAVSTALAAVGVAAYAVSPNVALFASAALVVGWGSGAVDTGLNTYAAEHFAARHMAWLHAAYSAGAALGAATMTLFVGERAGWRYGYGVVASVLVALAVAFSLTTGRWSRNGVTAHAHPASAAVNGAARRALTTVEALRVGSVRLQALIFFVYSGVELGVGHWSYTILTQARGIEPRRAALMVSVYWICLFLGRVLSGFIVERVGNPRLVRVGTVAASLGGAAFAVRTLPPTLTALALALLGLAVSPIYPSLMSETPRRVGALAAPHAVGFQVSAATAGAVTLPTLGGILAARGGPEETALFIAGARRLPGGPDAGAVFRWAQERCAFLAEPPHSDQTSMIREF